MIRAKARHILITNKNICEATKEAIDKGENFVTLAKKISECPSGKEGGDLGYFSPGQMVKEFDKVIFEGEVGKVYGPIKTQFGYHIIEILELENSDKV